MKVKLLFPFINEINTTIQTKDLCFDFVSIPTYFQNPTFFYSQYEKFNLNQEYILEKGFKGSIYANNQSMYIPYAEYEDYEKISPNSIPALFELIFRLYPYIIEKNIEDRDTMRSTEKIIERGHRIISGIASEIKHPLVSINNSEYEMFTNFFRIVTTKDYKRLQNALLYWKLSYEREDFIDSILDLAIAVESIFTVSDEQSLKIPIFVFHFLDTDRYRSLKTIYNLYRLRNRIIHGNDLPQITSDERMEIINVVAELLIKVIKAEKLPKTKDLEEAVYALYHSEVKESS